MTDHISRAKRSWNMSRIKSENTKPELSLRKELYKRGYRYRLNIKSLPGKPDIVFLKKKIAIFVHGCFWHRHGCSRSTMPKSNISYWRKKFDSNINRDNKVKESLYKLGWQQIVIWECEINNNLAGAVEAVQTALENYES